MYLNISINTFLFFSSKEEFEFLIEKLKSNCSEEERKKIGINLES